MGMLTLCHPAKLCALIGELEAPSVGLINELADKGKTQKPQNRSTLKSACSPPLTRLSDGITVTDTRRGSLPLDVEISGTSL